MNPSETKTRFEALVNMRKIPEQTWDLIEQYIMPMHGGKFFDTQQTSGSIDYRAPDIYDSTALIGVDTLSAAIHGSLTSPAIRWFDLRFRNPEYSENAEYQKWIESVRDKIYAALYDSNFDMEVAESYLDLVGFGNSAMSLEVENDLVWKGLNFGIVPLREVYFEEDAKGELVNFYRWLQLTPLQVVEKFGDDTPDDILQKSLVPAQADNKIDIIYAIVHVRGLEDIPVGKIEPVEKRPYKTMYIVRESGETIGKAGGAYEMPAFVTKWRRVSGSPWGYGPSNLAIPTVVSLNSQKELVMRAGEKVIDPALMVTERGLISDVDLSAGGVTIVRDLDRSMKGFESGARFDVSEMQSEDMRSQIRSIYKLDQLELKDSPAMTATEASIRYELMNRILGPTLGRIEKNKLTPIVERTFSIMMRANQFDDMPEGLEDADFDIQYTGPLARAQRMDNVVANERWLTTLGGLAEMFPNMLDLPDTDSIGREMAKDLGVPATSVKGKEVVTKERKEREEAQAAAQEAELAKMQGDATKAQGEGQQAINPTEQQQ